MKKIFKNIFNFIIGYKPKIRIYISHEELLSYFLGDNWKMITYDQIPTIVNGKVGYKLLYDFDTLNAGYRKMKKYYIDNVLNKK